MLRAIVLFALFAIAATIHAQWQLQDAHTTADLRGIDNVGHGVAWASGSDGTILRTEDAGFVWQLCAKPPGGEHLDFRAIQAFDNNTAIIMSSGKGDLSRLYKTTDGCQTWHLLFTNPDKDGFWDALKIIDRSRMIVIGDPARSPTPLQGNVVMFRARVSTDEGATWVAVTDPLAADEQERKGLFPLPEESLFAASNTSIVVTGGDLLIATSNSRVLRNQLPNSFRYPGGGMPDPFSMQPGFPWVGWKNSEVPIPHPSRSSGIFSIARGTNGSVVVVGGDYLKPSDPTGTAAYSLDRGKTWHAALTPPHGYRSAVAYDPTTKTWITVGPNGTDISTDDGRNWRALKPDLKFNDTPDADQHWNALSLPYAVGPHGRIGTLRPNALSRK